MVEHMECPRAFLGKLVLEPFFFFPLRTPLAVAVALPHALPPPQDVTTFVGLANYWGDFGEDDEPLLIKRIKPRDGHVPKRWYKHWITSDGSQAHLEKTSDPTRVRDLDKASATLTFLVVIVLGFLIVMVVMLSVCCRMNPYTVLDLETEKEMQA